MKIKYGDLKVLRAVHSRMYLFKKQMGCETRHFNHVVRRSYLQGRDTRDDAHLFATQAASIEGTSIDRRARHYLWGSWKEKRKEEPF